MWLKSNRLEDMKKIAAIVPYSFLPGQSGGQKLIIGFYDALGKITTLHVLGTPENNSSLATSYTFKAMLRSSQLRYADVFSFIRIKNYLKQQQTEWLFIEHPYLGWLAWMLKITTGNKLIIHTHNIEYQRFRSIGKWWWPLLKVYEKWVLQKADLVFCITEEDRKGFISELHISENKCVVIPYGIPQQAPPADKQETKEAVCKELNISAETRLLFFNGVLNYLPNLEALNNILHHINPLLLSSGLNYKILIAGKNLPATYNELKQWQQEHVLYLGFVHDINRYTKAADVLLNPVQSGGGVKTKMIEALGMDTTVVSTVTGAAGVSKELCGDKLMVVGDNDWEGFADAVIKSVDSSANITEEFYKTFSWEYIVQKVESII
jgi:glycosyltransferase involved in cell wall biosynthesis